MEKRYDIDAEREVFADRANKVCADFAKYLRVKGLNENMDEENPIVKKYFEAIDLERKAYKLKTYDEIDEAERKLNEIRGFYCELL
ncbi:MAG: hypothetical protein E7510_06870 [Ruminococcus sp.]|nr:hypothetical protein [Ruminococcus sp.]